MYSARNLEMSIRFSLKSQPSERFHRPEMSQIIAEISLRTNVKLNFHKNREPIDMIVIYISKTQNSTLIQYCTSIR